MLPILVVFFLCPDWNQRKTPFRGGGYATSFFTPESNQTNHISAGNTPSSASVLDYPNPVEPPQATKPAMNGQDGDTAVPHKSTQDHHGGDAWMQHGSNQDLGVQSRWNITGHHTAMRDTQKWGKGQADTKQGETPTHSHEGDHEVSYWTNYINPPGIACKPRQLKS